MLKNVIEPETVVVSDQSDSSIQFDTVPREVRVSTTFGSEVSDTESATRVAGSDSVRERLAIIFLRTREGGHSKRHTKRHTAGAQARKSTRDPNSTLGPSHTQSTRVAPVRAEIAPRTDATTKLSGYHSDM